MLTALIFLGTYGVIAAGRVPFLRIDRTGAALIGAILMVVTGAIGFDDAARSVDYRTIVLLFGMMVLVAHVRLAGGFTALVHIVTTRITHPAAMLVALVFTAGVLSALFVNDTICLVFTPIVLDVAEARGHRPLPYLLALATASNIGSVATLTGNPQNMLIGTLSRIPFRTFSAGLAPVALVGLALDAFVIWILFRRELQILATDAAEMPVAVLQPAALLKTGLVAAAMLVAFLAGYDTAVVSAAGAGALLITRRVPPRDIYSAIDWDLLMLFIGLFVVVGAAGQAGLADRLFAILLPLGIGSVTGLTATAALLANIVSNVPAVMLFARVIPRLPDANRAWLVLAMASTLAGNLTVVGSIANLIVVEGARRKGVSIGFWSYARVGVPITIATLVIGAWWLS